ncbi:MAG: cytidylate kinase-like family protein [Prevotella sp.]|nr:cytidylate kinase-like family protein [Prevotella sp.]
MNNIIISIGRQIGSGGLVIAKKLAEDLGCKFYDKELLNLAAKESGFNESFFKQSDEETGFFKSFFHLNIPFSTGSNPENNKLSQENLFHFQSEAIRNAAQEHSCVFVGRCADYVLRDFENVVTVFITADLKERAKRVSERHACTLEEALKIIELSEKRRSSYYNYYTGKIWGDSKSYDLCLSSSILGTLGTVEFIKAFAKRKLGF